MSKASDIDRKAKDFQPVRDALRLNVQRLRDEMHQETHYNRAKLTVSWDDDRNRLSYNISCGTGHNLWLHADELEDVYRVLKDWYKDDDTGI